MGIRKAARVAAFALLVLAVTAAAGAQGVVTSSFDQMRLVARLGDTLTVTDSSGSHIKGTLSNLSSSSLELLVNGQHLHLAQPDVLTINRHDHAKLATGAKVGLVIGATLGALAGVALRSECRGCDAFIPMFAAVYGGLGAGIGVGIAALTPTRPVIFDSGAMPHPR